MAKTYIGTSGWQYRHWQGSFYPPNLPTNQWLSFYTKAFNTVEVNSSFYRLTAARTFLKWQEQTNDKFVFSIKGNRFITHTKRLNDCQESLRIFFRNVGALEGNHIILWQLPPNLKLNIGRLTSFITLLPKTFRYAFEFRHSSWVDPLTWDCLKEHNIAVVFQDWGEWPIVEVETADYIYLRFHGNKTLYTSGYTDEELAGWSIKVKKWLRDGKDVYAYFNNDAAGFAVPNALMLKKLA